MVVAEEIVAHEYHHGEWRVCSEWLAVSVVVVHIPSARHTNITITYYCYYHHYHYYNYQYFYDDDTTTYYYYYYYYYYDNDNDNHYYHTSTKLLLSNYDWLDKLILS